MDKEIYEKLTFSIKCLECLLAVSVLSRFCLLLEEGDLIENNTNNLWYQLKIYSLRSQFFLV
jgi:hypothetical protein